MTLPPTPRPIALTVSSGIGGDHAARFITPAGRLKRESESLDMRAILLAAAPTLIPCRAQSSTFPGCWITWAPPATVETAARLTASSVLPTGRSSERTRLPRRSRP